MEISSIFFTFSIHTQYRAIVNNNFYTRVSTIKYKNIFIQNIFTRK